MMTLCVNCETRPIENRDTGMCATCGALFRKAERMSAMVKVVKPIRRVSKKMAKELVDYGILRRQHLLEHPECEVRLPGICDGQATSIHHCAKRGKNLLRADTFKSACDSCHRYIEDVMSADERMEKGLLRTVDGIV